MQPISSNPMAAQHMRASGVTIPDNSGAAGSVLNDIVASGADGNTPPEPNPTITSMPMSSRVKLTADELTALQSVGATISASTPAGEARAAIAADPQFANLPFGRIVSQFARGEITLAGDSSIAASTSASDQQSADGSTSDVPLSDSLSAADTTQIDDMAPMADDSGVGGGSAGEAADSSAAGTDESTDLSSLESAATTDEANALAILESTAGDPTSDSSSPTV